MEHCDRFTTHKECIADGMSAKVAMCKKLLQENLFYFSRRLVHDKNCSFAITEFTYRAVASTGLRGVVATIDG